MTSRNITIIDGPSQQELIIAQWDWTYPRKSVVFHEERGEWRMEIVGARAIDGSGRHFLINAFMGTLRKDNVIHYGRGMVVDIDYCTDRRKGVMTVYNN